jgi:symplekin
MDKAAVEEKRCKALTADSKKRPLPASNDQASDPKRLKLEQEHDSATSASFLAAFDFTSLPASLITELIVANIEAFTEPTLIALVQSYRLNRAPDLSAPIPPVPVASATPAQNLAPESISTPLARPATPPSVKQESVDPLQMDIDEEFEYEPDRLNLEV